MKSDEVLKTIEEAYHVDGANGLNDEELQQSVLDGNIPTVIVDARASSSCGNPSVSDYGRFTMDNDPFIATGQKSDKYS